MYLIKIYILFNRYYNKVYFIKKEGVYSVMYDLLFLKNSKKPKNRKKMTMTTTKKNQIIFEGNSDHLPVIFSIPNFDNTYKRSNHVYPKNLKVELILKGK